MEEGNVCVDRRRTPAEGERQTMFHARIVCGAYLHIFFDLEFEVSHSDSSASIEEDN